MIPVDAKMPRNEDRYSDDFFDMREKPCKAMLYSSAENKILIIDACRDNPAAKKIAWHWRWWTWFCPNRH
ncbi:MAG: hypothetical protein IPI79_10265 [Moraxellaceae bacterium]|nr:hypothetical protein [Moraxellaceae bacterium]